MEKNLFKERFLNEKLIAIALVLIALVVPVQLCLIHHFNNFIIFKVSFLHLVHGLDLYPPYPKEYDDVYLYSPTFAMLMAPFAYLANWLGLFVWSALNCTAVYFAIRLLPHTDKDRKLLIFFVLLLELVTSVQNTQTSPALVAFMVLSFVSFERRKPFWAAFFIILAAFIKVYALAAAVLFFLYPGKWRFIASMVFWGIVFALLPLIVIPGKQLVFLYQSWVHQMADVHQSEQTGINPNLVKPPLSVMGWLKTWFHWNPPAVIIQLLGALCLCLPLLRFKEYREIRFRYFLLSSVLIFCMIFNHIAESPSYIVAVFGLALWFGWERKTPFVYSLMAIAFVFTIVSATDFFPEYIRHNYAIPYVWKAVPCIMVWIWLQYRMMLGKFENETI